jgi:hypothetical protein
VATTDNKIFKNIPEDKLRRLEAICDRLSPCSAVIAEILPTPTIPKALDDFYTRSADVIAVSLPDPTIPKAPLDDFYKRQEADRKEIEELDKEFDRLKIETAEISKSLELQAEDIGNNGQVSTPSINKNDLEFSGLLQIPKNAGNWGFAIDDMARDFYNQNKRLPNNKAEAWTQLCTSPPAGYGITVVGKNEKLNIVSAKPLTQRAFDTRWKKYTK